MSIPISDGEWEIIGMAPLAAAAAVAVADEGGAEREVAALLAAWLAAAERYAASPLIAQLLADFDPAGEQTRITQGLGLDPLEEAVTLCSSAVSVLRHKASAIDVQEYVAFVGEIAEAVANAESTGGMFDFGGVPESLDEHRALRAIRVALGHS